MENVLLLNKNKKFKLYNTNSLTNAFSNNIKLVYSNNHDYFIGDNNSREIKLIKLNNDFKNSEFTTQEIDEIKFNDYTYDFKM